MKGRDDLEELSLDWRLILKWDLEVCIWFSCPCIGASCVLLGTRCWTFGLHGREGSYWLNRASTPFTRGASFHEVVFNTCIPMCVCVCMYVCNTLQLTALQEAEKQTGVQQSPQDWGIGCSLSLGISIYWGEMKEGGSGTGHTMWHYSASEFVHFDVRDTHTHTHTHTHTNIKLTLKCPSKLFFKISHFLNKNGLIYIRGLRFASQHGYRKCLRMSSLSPTSAGPRWSSALKQTLSTCCHRPSTDAPLPTAAQLTNSLSSLLILSLPSTAPNIPQTGRPIPKTFLDNNLQTLPINW